jgi:hypothetical protein
MQYTVHSMQYTVHSMQYRYADLLAKQSAGKTEGDARTGPVCDSVKTKRIVQRRTGLLAVLCSEATV